MSDFLAKNSLVKVLVNNPFSLFLIENRSLSLAFLYIIMTAIIMHSSVMSLIVHTIGYILTFSLRWQAGRAHGSSCSVLLLMVVAMTALGTEVSQINIIVQFVSWGVLGLLWWQASLEAKARELTVQIARKPMRKVW